MLVKFTSNVRIGAFKALLVVLVCPVHSAVYYQHYQQRFPPPPRYPPPRYLQHPRQVRQTPFFVNTQRYVAVPGRIVQHFNAATVPLTTFPAPTLQNFPLVSPLYYELESDPSSSNPDNNNDGGEDGSGGLEPPPPQPQPEEPPPMMEPEPMPQPQPPPPEDNNDGNDQDNDNQPPPPPSDPHVKIVHKHISIHVPPAELEEENDQVTVIKPKIPGPEKHINIIFVKAPVMKSRKAKTEVILPEQPEQKTLVYVLVKRPDPANDGSIRVSGPPPAKPKPPQVYFITYKQKKEDKKEYGYVEKKRTSYHHSHH